jgi:hypothetical protein
MATLRVLITSKCVDTAEEMQQAFLSSEWDVVQKNLPFIIVSEITRARTGRPVLCLRHFDITETVALSKDPRG